MCPASESRKNDMKSIKFGAFSINKMGNKPEMRAKVVNLTSVRDSESCMSYQCLHTRNQGGKFSNHRATTIQTR